MIPIIDTHQHLWERDVLDLAWIKGAGTMDDDYPISRYMEAAAGGNVAKTVYMEVNSGVAQQHKEVDYVVDLCRRDDNPMCAIIAGGEPASDSFADFVGGFRDHPYVVGTRQVLHGDESPQGFCLEPAFVAGVQLLGELGLTFDLCLRPRELADAAGLVDRCPGTQFILDHCGNADPFVVSGRTVSDPGTTYALEPDRWRDDMRALGERPNVACKISGIAVHSQGTCDPDVLAPTVNHCLDSFGPDRVVFGGDWPVCTMGSPLADWIGTLRQIVSNRSEADQRKLFYDNAARIFGLE